MFIYSISIFSCFSKQFRHISCKSLKIFESFLNFLLLFAKLLQGLAVFFTTFCKLLQVFAKFSKVFTMFSNIFTTFYNLLQPFARFLQIFLIFYKFLQSSARFLEKFICFLIIRATQSWTYFQFSIFCLLFLVIHLFCDVNYVNFLFFYIMFALNY